MSTAELWQLSAIEQAAGVRDGHWSAQELTRSVLDRIAERDSELNAYCTLDETAMGQARVADRARQRGERLGPLHGVPFSVKDLIPTRGLRTTLGSLAYADWIPDQDEAAVARMRAAGAVLVGKTNTRELGYGVVADNALFGPTANPWAPERTAGGSSGGAAAAVAAGMGSVALGNDGGGSLRVPAALCGAFTIKPTFGLVPLFPACRVPIGPGVSSWESLECIGPITRTVADAAAVLTVLAGLDLRDRHSFAYDTDEIGHELTRGVAGLRIAWSPHLGGAQVSPEILATTETAVELLGGLGATIERVDPPIGPIHELRETFAATVARDSDLAGLRKLADRYEVSPDIRELVSRAWTAEDFTTAAMRRQSLYNAMHAFMHGYDVLITPTTATTAFPLGLRAPEDGFDGVDDGRQWSPFAFVFNLTGQPAASIPVGRSADGLPVGLQIVGSRLGDATVLRVAHALEEAIVR